METFKNKEILKITSPKNVEFSDIQTISEKKAKSTGKKLKPILSLEEILALNSPANFSHVSEGFLYYSIRTGNMRITIPIDILKKENMKITFVESYKPQALSEYISKALDDGNLTISVIRGL